MGNEEKNLRDEIRRQLEEEEQSRLDKKKIAGTVSGKKVAAEKVKKIPQEVKEYIYLKEGWKFYKDHDDILICANHLGEIMFCTPNQVQLQNEFFDEGNDGEKMVQKRLRKKPDYDLNNPEANQYGESVKLTFISDFEKWLTINKKRVEELAAKEAAKIRSKIVEEEKEKFYKEHPEFHKYFNHLGEFKWMTEDDFRLQNEFYPPEENFIERIFSNTIVSFVGIAALFVVVIAAIWLFWPENGKYAFLKINSNVTDFRLMAERTNFLVHEKQKVLKFPLQGPLEGKVRAFKPGYKLIHGDTTLKLTIGDTTEYFVFMRAIEASDQLSSIKLEANIGQAKIFVNRSYYGEYPELSTLLLEPGIYEIQMYKDQYRNLSEPQLVDITQDTSGRTLSFSFELVSKILESKASRIKGSIGISTNVPNADVYVNGELRGKSNLVLNNLSAGRYRIKVSKNGYNVVPESRIVELGAGREVMTIDFTLMSTSGQLVLDVSPENATIFLDGKNFTKGDFQGVVSQGNHVLTPQPLNGYRTPGPVNFNLKQNDYKKLSITYSPDIAFKVDLNSNGQMNRSGDIRVVLGYERLGIFREDESLGPQIIENEVFGFSWLMGFALRFEDPPGNDGFIYILNIPSEFDFENPVFFEWTGYKLRDNYPITPSEGHSLRLTVNGKSVFNNLEPKYFIDDAGSGSEKVSINRYLRPGNNRLEFSVTDDNSSYYLLKQIRIH